MDVVTRLLLRQINRTMGGGQAIDPNETKIEKHLRKQEEFVRTFFGRALILGSSAIVLFAFGVTVIEVIASDRFLIAAPFQALGRFTIVLGIGTLLAMAAMAPTGLLGFLFGTERAPEAPPHEIKGKDTAVVKEPKADGEQEVPRDQAPVRQSRQTNLEQISDWLTKILLGAGLTQLDRATAAFQGMAQSAADAGFSLQQIDVEPLNSIPALCVMMYFGVISFVWAYMTTRMRVPMALDAAELAGASYRVSNADIERLDEMSKRGTKSPKKIEDGYSKKLTGSSSAASSTPEELEAALRIRSTPLSELTELSDLIAVARANTIGHDRNRAKAIDAFRLAIAKSPTTIGLYTELAWEYWKSNKIKNAARTMFEGAHVAQNLGDVASYEKMLSDAIYYSLYSEPPESFTYALAWLNEFGDKGIDADSSGQLLIYRICANGQKFSSIAGSAEELNEKQLLLESIKADISKAIKLDSSWRDFLISIFNPDGDREDARDVDLVALYKDPIARTEIETVLAT